jgi:HNH endonuclease
MTRPSAHRRGYTRRWQSVVRYAIEVHVRLFGWTCPGWGVPSHHSVDLTGDHELALSLGGLSSAANVQILCRSCNARKGNRPPVRVQLTLDICRTRDGAVRHQPGQLLPAGSRRAVPSLSRDGNQTGGLAQGGRGYTDGHETTQPSDPRRGERGLSSSG